MNRDASPIVAGVLLAVASAVAFGASTPFIARFGVGAGPFSTAALLYAGASAVSIASGPFVRRSGRALTRDALPRLAVVAIFGAALAPVLLAWGIGRAGPIGASLALNFEAAFTVLLARAVYGEKVGRRVAVAVTIVLVGGGLLALDGARRTGAGEFVGVIAVIGATACWALDNTLTRALAEFEPLEVVAAKGAFGATTTGGLAILLHEPTPLVTQSIPLLICGAVGYGLSLRLYLLAQRRIGAGRTGSVFAIGPFVGAALGWALGDRAADRWTALSGAAFAIGVYLHLTERHRHAHVHEASEHEHAHRHDDGHHDHRHVPAVTDEHTHWHRHERLEHEHEHAPDIHHEHRH